MILLILLLFLALWGIIATLVEVRRDGLRQRPTDPTRVAEVDRCPTPSRGA